MFVFGVLCSCVRSSAGSQPSASSASIKTSDSSKHYPTTKEPRFWITTTLCPSNVSLPFSQKPCPGLAIMSNKEKHSSAPPQQPPPPAATVQPKQQPAQPFHPFQMVAGQTLNRLPKTTAITDDYEISTTVLGQGINGKVVQCTDRRTGSVYALKVGLKNTKSTKTK